MTSKTCHQRGFRFNGKLHSFESSQVQFSPLIKLAAFQGTRYTADKVPGLEGHLDLHPRHPLRRWLGSPRHTVG